MAMPVQHVATPRNRTPPKPNVKRRLQALSVAQLLNAASRFPDAKMAQWITVSRTAHLQDNAGRPVLRGETLTAKPNTPPKRGHKCSFRAVDPKYKGKFYQCKAVMADCNCHRFLFVWEYALWYRGAAQLMRSNGEHPIETNPGLKIGLCKHLIVLARTILTKRL